jgi:hypothetical protein
LTVVSQRMANSYRDRDSIKAISGCPLSFETFVWIMRKGPLGKKPLLFCPCKKDDDHVEQFSEWIKRVAGVW